MSNPRITLWDESPLIALRSADPWGTCDADRSDPWDDWEGEPDADPGFDRVPCADEAEAAAVREHTRATRAAWRAKIGLAP